MQVVPPAIISARCARAFASSAGSVAALVAATVDCMPPARYG
jgi:hypothetical protein